MRAESPAPVNSEPISSIPGGAVVGTFLALLLTGFVVALNDIDVVPSRSALAWNQAFQQPAGGGEALDDTSVVTLHRSGCCGLCPVYRLSLYGSGRVEYEGVQFICAYGHQTASVDPQSVRQLIEGMVAAGYFDLQLRDDIRFTGVVTTSLTHQGRTRTIENWAQAQLLQKIEERIDEVAGSARWLPVPDEQWSPVCPGANDRQIPVLWLAKVHALPECGANAKPVSLKPPRTPYLHVQSSTLDVGFVVESSGLVSNPVILSLDETVRNGFIDMLLSTIEKWRYAPVEQACRHEMKIRVIYE